MLARIERSKANRVADQGGREHDRMTEAVGRMNIDSWTPPKTLRPYDAAVRPPQLPHSPSYMNSGPTISQQNASHTGGSSHRPFSPSSPSANQYFPPRLSSPPHGPSQGSPYAASGYVPPPPPAGPPPSHSNHMAYDNYNRQSPTNQYRQQQMMGQPQNGSDPWAALSGWK